MSEIVITKNLISKLFFKYNKEYFDNKLQLPNFDILHSKRLLGQFRTKEHKKPKILITKDVEWTENDLRDILVHEMVHLYVWEKTGKNNNKHNGLFKKVCAELKEKYGIDVRRPDILTRDYLSFWQLFKKIIMKKPTN